MNSADLAKLRDWASESVELRNVLSPALHHILPGGTLYRNPHINDDDRAGAALDRFRKAARATLSHQGQRPELETALFDYLHVVEQQVRDIDLGRLDHQKLLLTLRMLLPPQPLSRPLVFVIAGPVWLGQGYRAARGPRGVAGARPSETTMHPFLRYQLPLAEAEFSQLSAAGEVTFAYEVYGNHYGF
jgi:hypothetical protein